MGQGQETEEEDGNGETENSTNRTVMGQRTETGQMRDGGRR